MADNLWGEEYDQNEVLSENDVGAVTSDGDIVTVDIYSKGITLVFDPEEWSDFADLIRKAVQDAD
jgi:hypothetical protein